VFCSLELTDWLNARATAMPDRIALSVASRRWTFRELDEEASRVARRLHSLGVRGGDRVATLLPNGFASSILPHAVIRLGAIIAPLNTRLTRAEIEWQVGHVAPSTVISSDDVLNGTVSSDVELRLSHPEDAVAAIIYTSDRSG
jgi:o-succinylbenzoate---CoA ligase